MVLVKDDSAMKTSHALLLPAFLCTLTTLGCGPMEVEPELGDDTEAASEGETSFRAAPADACSDSRRIAIKNNPGACPAPPGWAGTKLFSGAAGVMDDFCRYDWVGMGPPNPMTLDADPNVVAHEKDCEVVHEQGTDALTTAYQPLVYSMAREAVNAPSAADLNLPASEHSRKPVTLAVVDTTPSGAPSPRSIHSESMVDIADTIACPNGNSPCAVETVEVLGMPRYQVDGPADTTNGGHFGSLGDLAAGIHEAVENWEAANVGAPIPSKLVLNLSLGWESTFFGSGPAEEAVFAAIEEVYCKGGIVIAAAGNSSEMCTSDALLPGAWESAPVPDQFRCNQLIPGSPAPSTAGYRPLVHAVGGLDRGGAPFSKARPGGMPRLAAIADHVLSDDTDVPHTGTSTSAAAVSGAVALAWSYAPDLEAGEVLEQIYNGSQLVGGHADFWGSGVSDTRLRQLDVCTGLDAACSVHGSCGSLPLSCVASVPTTTTAHLVAAADAIGPGGGTSVEFDAPEVCSDSCGTTHYGYLGDAAGLIDEACPPLHDPVDMFVHPQPTQPSCPNCTFKLDGGGDASLYATLDSEWAGYNVSDMYVTVYDGTSYRSYYLGEQSIDSSDWYEIALEDRVPATVRSATITMYFDSGERSASSLIVDR